MFSHPSSYTKDLLMHQVKTLHSRAHPLNTIPGYIKREDELSFGISGPKLRKLLPLIASLAGKRALLKGSAYSNFILGAVQLLTEHQIDYRLLLKKPNTAKIAGNLSYLLRMVPSYRFLSEGDPIDGYIVVEEGGKSLEALEGAKTLAGSILRNEEELGIEFSKVIIDAGTGVTASGLILGLKELSRNLPVHVFSMKAHKAEIEGQFHFHQLTRYKAFGSVPQGVLDFINDFAQREGIFLDPLYGAKMHLELCLNNTLLDERSLIIHSGGALSLSGF